MKIIIVGSGRVGRTLAEELQNEGADITLVDVSERKINMALEDVDAMGIIGNGASINILMEAGIESANILIAVTGSDELNLLCCLIAQKASSCHTIARVRNPVYGSEIGFIKERLGLSMFINPELSTAQEISRLLRFPSASKIDTFARGRVELLKFKVLPELHLGSMTVSQIAEKLKCEILFCAVEHNNEITIPNGNSMISVGDMVYIMGTPKKVTEFFRKVGLKTTQVRNVMVVGGGTISYYLATLLQDMKIDIKIIEKDRERCEFLAERLPGATIINGDGTDRDLLLEEGLPNAEALVALTNLDEENIFLALSAKKYSSAKLIAKVDRLPFNDVIDSLDIDSVIYPKYVTADSILQYVRAMQNASGSNVETLYHIMENRAEALEFRVNEASPVVGTPLSKLKLRPHLLVACLNRNGNILIPHGNDMIQVGDTVIIVTTNEGLRDITDILAR